MIEITLIKGSDGLWYPATKADGILLAHCMNVPDIAAANQVGLDGARYVAAAHGWHIITKDN